MKADKGNQVIVMNKETYDERMLKSIKEDNFNVCKKSPLSSMVNDARTTIDTLHKVFGVNKFKLRVSNPHVPMMYGLPKVHKPGEKMRKIVSFINSPFEKICKWLVVALKDYGDFEGFAVKNTTELVEKIKDVELNEDEILVSFDVTALFPSVPIDDAIEALKEHLHKKNVNIEHISAYTSAVETCMKYNCFQFRNTYYSCSSGCSMGNNLSPFVAEAFMSKFESDLHKEGLLPRIWLRYVDDVLAVIKKSDLDHTLNILNNRFNSIKFTSEIEDEVSRSISFLDIKIKRVNNKLEFAVYRKQTTTERLITSDSFCSYQNKIAAFHSMVHRLCSLPLSVADYKSEYDHITKLADINGYQKSFVDKLVQKHSRKIKNNNLSTLFSQNQQILKSNEKRVAVTYAPTITNKLQNSFERCNIKMVYSGNEKLKSALGSTKDKLPFAEKSGIYEIKCSNCNYKYIGQTRRSIKKRFDEHHRSIKNKEIDKAIAAHIYNTDNSHPHKIISFEDNTKLLKNVKNQHKLDAYESFYISTSPNLMNFDDGPISSPLFSLFKKTSNCT